jgi:hypothetical protein
LRVEFEVVVLGVLAEAEAFRRFNGGIRVTVVTVHPSRAVTLELELVGDHI